MNQIKKERSIGEFTRSSNEGKVNYSLVPDKFFKIIEKDIGLFSNHVKSHQVFEQFNKFRDGKFNTDDLIITLIVAAGIRFDEMKLSEVLERVAKLYTDGAIVHGENNWKSEVSEESLKSFIESGFRHFVSAMHYKKGFTTESQDEDHLAACIWNILGADYVINKLNE